MTSQELFEQMSGLWTQFEKEHTSGTKAGAGRARKSIGELKKMVTDYRAASVSESK
jgi:hypothetical protein